MVLDILDDGAELPLPERTVRPTGRAAWRRDVADQVDSEKVGQGLGRQPPPGAAGGELGIHRQHRGPELWLVDAVERRDRQPRRVEVELFGGDPPDQLRLQEDVEHVPVAA